MKRAGKEMNNASGEGNSAAGCFGLVITAVVFFLLTSLCIPGMRNDVFGGLFGCKAHRTSSKPEPLKFEDSAAVAYVQERVLKELKAPSTAEFVGVAKVTRPTGSDIEKAARTLNIDPDHLWMVAGEVDAQNSFGAMLRNSYAGLVEFHPDKGYRVINIIIE